MLDSISENNVYKNYVGGEWVIADDSLLISIYSPIDKSLIGKVPAMNKAEVDKAIRIAKESQIEWSNIPLNKKADILYKVSEILEKEVDVFVDVLVREVAKDKKSARSEVLRTADFIRYTADAAKNMIGEYVEGDAFPGFKKNKVANIKRVPLGVVLAISPFNYPINLAAAKIAPAIIAGNTVVFKPATQGSISGLHLIKAFEEAGVPEGIINTVTGRGNEIGDYIVTHSGIDMINFTGSTAVGERISELTKMKPLLMELGGKDPAIVLSDADIKNTASQIVNGAFSYSGQRCTAVKRVLVEEAVADELVKELKEHIEKLKVGNPLVDEDVNICTLIDSKSADNIESLIKDTIDNGGKLIVGGKREGNLIYPTLFDNVSLKSRLAWEEPFGPILPVIRVKDKDEAIKIANESKYGLQASVFTKDINDCYYIADKLEVGTVQINNKTERGPDNFPFLGVKASGMGVQGIRASIESMSRPKIVVINL